MAELPDPTCGDCLAFTGEEFDDRERILGRCRFRPELGLVPETLRWCDSYQVRPSRKGRVRIPVPTRPAGAGRKRVDPPAVKRRTLERPTTGNTRGEITVDRDGLKQVLRELLEEETLYGYPEIAPKWHDGELLLMPGDPELQPKTLPLDSLFHKVVMVRDRLRVLEAKINAHSKLDEADKVELQAYLSKCYGTLTSFNVLFRNREDQFRSS